MVRFAQAIELEHGSHESIQSDISEALDFLNQLFLNEYGTEKDEIHKVSVSGKYPKISTHNQLNYNDVYSFREYDAQIDQRTIRDNSRFRYNNAIKPWQMAGHRQRHHTENTGLRLGTFAEKESLNRGYAMETILAPNRYNTKPEYHFDQMLSHTDRLQ